MAAKHTKGGIVDAAQGKGRCGQSVAAVALDKSKATEKRKLRVVESAVIVRQHKTDHMPVR